MTPVTDPADTRVSRYARFLKGERKALGTVQFMIGSMTFVFGIILNALGHTPAMINIMTLWGSLIYISSSALSIAAANHQTSCLVKASLGMNIFSAVVAGLSLILFSLDMVFEAWHGIYGVLLVFAVLEFISSICSSVFACNITCCTETTEFENSKSMYSELLTTQVMYTPAFIKPQVPPQATTVAYGSV